MADTARSLAAIQALFADNSAGAISPQDLRDAVETLATKYGEIYVSSSSATSITDTTSYFDIAGTWTLGQAKQFDENTNGQLRYTGTPDVEAMVKGSVSVTVAGNNDIVHLEIRKNGQDVTGSDATLKLATGADVQSFSVLGVVSLSTNDYITLAVRNETATDNITAVEAHLVVEAWAI